MPNLLLQNPAFIHNGDVISLIAGNNLRLLTQDSMDNVNEVAGQLKDRFGSSIRIVLATAGLVNVQFAATRVSNDIDGLSFVYEPKYRDFPDGDNNLSGPNFFSPPNTNQFNNYSQNLMDDCQAATNPQGLTMTWRVTGRLIRTSATQVVSDYGFLAKMCDGSTVQTQRFLAGSLSEFRDVVDEIVRQYQNQGILGQRDLSTRITVGPQTQHNGVTASVAMQGANYAWGKNGVTMPALFPATGEMPEVTKFYQLREQ